MNFSNPAEKQPYIIPQTQIDAEIWGGYAIFGWGLGQPPRKIQTVFHLCYNNITAKEAESF